MPDRIYWIFKISIFFFLENIFFANQGRTGCREYEPWRLFGNNLKISREEEKEAILAKSKPRLKKSQFNLKMQSLKEKQ